MNGLSNIEIDSSDAATCNQRVVGPYRSRPCFHCEIRTKDICKAFALACCFQNYLAHYFRVIWRNDGSPHNNESDMALD
jgi:hypothetical protein